MSDRLADCGYHSPLRSRAWHHLDYLVYLLLHFNPRPSTDLPLHSLYILFSQKFPLTAEMRATTFSTLAVLLPFASAVPTELPPVSDLAATCPHSTGMASLKEHMKRQSGFTISVRPVSTTFTTLAAVQTTLAVAQTTPPTFSVLRTPIPRRLDFLR